MYVNNIQEFTAQYFNQNDKSLPLLVLQTHLPPQPPPVITRLTLMTFELTKSQGGFLCKSAATSSLGQKAINST